MANEFMDIMRLMNNGVNNESTLDVVYPRIVTLGVNLNIEKVSNLQEWLFKEEELSKPHPGLNEVVISCNTTIDRYKQNGIVR